MLPQPKRSNQQTFLLRKDVIGTFKMYSTLHPTHTVTSVSGTFTGVLRQNPSRGDIFELELTWAFRALNIAKSSNGSPDVSAVFRWASACHNFQVDFKRVKSWDITVFIRTHCV